MRNARDGLIPKIWKFADRVYGEVAIHEAWSEFNVWKDVEFDHRSPEMLVFLPFFIDNWTPDPKDTKVLACAPKDLPPAAAFLNENRARLDPMECRYIEACLPEPLTFFEVVENFPNEGFILRDILTERELRVAEKSGSQTANRGDILFGKSAMIDDVTILESRAPLLIPPAWKEPILNLWMECVQGNL